MQYENSMCERSEYMNSILTTTDRNLLTLYHNNVFYFYIINYLININIIYKINQINVDYKEFPKLSQKNHLIKCFYHDFNHEQNSEVIKTFYSKLFSGIEV